MNFRVLGPVEVSAEGRSIDLGPLKQRSLLALLLIHANQVVSVDRILEELWGEKAEGKREALLVHVSRLRTALEPERAESTILLTEEPGYLLSIDPEEIDAVKFEQMTTEGRALVDRDPDAASGTLGKALDLWQGSAYEDFARESFAEQEIARLQDLRLEAIENRIEADLRRGQSEELVSELESLSREHPTRERLVSQLMVALYRSGRHADALRAYERSRSILASELGIEPSAELRRLEERILLQDPTLDLDLEEVVEATILITDLEGSTALWELDADAMAPALERHDEIIRTAVMEAGGAVFKGTGDGLLANLPDTSSAVSAAESAQRGLAAEDWGHLGELRARMAIYVGETRRRGTDYFGPALNRAARMVAAGHGGQVLLSSMAQTQLSESGSSELIDLGEYTFKGIPEPEQVFQLVIQGLLSDFPELRPTEVEEGALSFAVGPPNPYKGLRPFREDDAEDFFGRERLVAALVEKLSGQDRLLALIGPSGSGKSSVVRAGLLPELHKAALPGSDLWLVAQMLPGAHPFAELEAALLRSTLDPPQSLSDQLQEETTGLLRAALRVLPSEDSRLVLVIDQFEELFTLVEDEHQRRRFLTNLATAVEDPRGRIDIVLTLRADFYGRPLLYPEFGELLTSNVINVMPLSAEELEAAAVQPARKSGLSLESALLAELITDVADEPGALPLFQYTLADLFDRREGDTLTISTYRSIGGLRGSLTRRADELYHQLDPEQQEAARQLFLRLVAVTEEAEDSRRRVLASEITALDVDKVAMQAAIAIFGEHRLLTFDRDQASGAPTVEVAHEALLREWERLREWIDQSREDLRRHATYTVAVDEWLAADRDPDYLLTGARLDQYQQWRNATALRLTETEREYLDAALERREAEQAAEEARYAQEKRLRRRARRGLWAAAAAVVALAVIGGVLLVGALRPTVAIVGIDRGRGPIDDLMAIGIDRAARDFAFDAVEEPVLADPEGVLRDLSDGGAELIIAGLDFQPVVESVAPEFPDAQYVVIDAPVVQPNVASVVFAVEEGSYLVGAAAALESQTGIIGFVGGMSAFAQIEAFRAGYEAGARAADPNTEIRTAFLSYWFDGFASPDEGRAAASELFEAGADVVFHAAGFSGLGVVEAASEHGRWAIGVDADEYLLHPDRLKPYILTSMIKRYDTALYEVIRDFVEDGFEPGIRLLNLADEGVDFSTEGGHLSQSTIEVVNGYKSRIVSGDIVVPQVPDDPPPSPFFIDIRDVSAVATVTWDGVTCSYDGATSFVDGAVVQFEFVNTSSQLAGVGVFNLDGQYLSGFVHTHGSQQAPTYAVLDTGTHDVSCLPDGFPDPFVPATELTVGES